MSKIEGVVFLFTGAMIKFKTEMDEEAIRDACFKGDGCLKGINDSGKDVNIYFRADSVIGLTCNSETLINRADVRPA